MWLSSDRLTHSFGRQPALFRDLTFTLAPGRLTGLVGPSGSGKSTLLSILAGQVVPTGGRIRSEGVKRVGWILQNPVGSPRRSALDHVVFPLLLWGLTREEAERRAEYVLEVFQLSSVRDRPFRSLSGGEAQRLAFARATTAQYDVLLLDEPTAQLDPQTAYSIRQVIRGLVAGNRIVLLATHDVALRDQCDDVVELGAG